MYIFIDESGDLGFDFIKGKPSDFFLVGALKLSDITCINRIIKRHRKRVKKKKEEKKEVKFSNTSPENRRRILEDISKLNVDVFSVYIDKRNAYGYVKDDPVRMYSYLLKILAEKCFQDTINEDVTIIFDRCFTKVQQEALELYLKTQNESILKTKNKITMLHMSSQDSVGLMCVDFICGAAMHKISGKGELYFNIIKDKVKCLKKLY
jgi:hypothetical protein